ncbi:MAG: hypothetical protein C4326_03995 [Ignavibacteria bacterium]
MKPIVVTALIVVATWSGLAQQSATSSQQRTVTVRGEASTTVEPDQIRMTVQVSARADAAVDAMRAAGTKTKTVLGVLKRLGVPEQTIQTTRATIAPVYDYARQIQPPPIIGYTASNEFTVLFKGKTMENVGAFMDQAVEAGATNFGNLVFESSRQRAIEREALTKAAADAHARAQVLAKELGASLGQVLSISESVVGRPGPIMMRSAAETAAPIMSGELTITASVEVVFALQ